ncbi:MAG: hypothetical protein U1E60_09030 [Reyranellaceae bacterium]
MRDVGNTSTAIDCDHLQPCDGRRRRVEQFCRPTMLGEVGRQLGRYQGGPSDIGPQADAASNGFGFAPGAGCGSGL